VRVTVSITHIPDDQQVMLTVANWSVQQWRSDFPSDTVETYLTLFRSAIASHDKLPFIFVAWNDNGAPIGTVTLIADDELPDATEPGPWLAALYVLPDFRHQGVGQALVDVVVSTARTTHHRELFLYTADQTTWYQKMGWTSVRTTRLADHSVVVMRKELY
jgi:predicted N-acetyltransferase YhbS